VSPAEFLYLDQTAMLQAGVLDMRRAIDVISGALCLLETGECAQPLKVVLRDGDARSEDQGRFNGLCASIKGAHPAVGMKWIGSYPQNRKAGLPRASAIIVLNSPLTGLPIAVVDGTLVSAVRTGAVTALGARFLARRGARKAAVIGGGVQPRTQILGLATAMPGLEEIAVFCRRHSQAESLRDDCAKFVKTPIAIAESAKAALVDADVVVTVTTASEPLVHAADLGRGVLTVQMSGHECDFDVVRECRKLVIDNWEGMMHRGIITPALMHAQGLLQEGDVHATLGELILGRKPGREDDAERIHFAHMGMGVEDVALASAVYDTARELGLGQSLKLWESPLWV
jgi:ornithine cyclodeaminase